MVCWVPPVSQVAPGVPLVEPQRQSPLGPVANWGERGRPGAPLELVRSGLMPPIVACGVHCGCDRGARVGWKTSAPMTAKTLNAQGPELGSARTVRGPGGGRLYAGAPPVRGGTPWGEGGAVAMGSNLRWRQGVHRRAAVRTPTEPLGRVLDAAENASPLEAVEAVTERAGRLAGARGGLLPDRGRLRTGSRPPLPCARGGRPGCAARAGRRAAARGSTTTSRPWRCRSTAAPPRRRCAPRRVQVVRLPRSAAGSGRATSGWCWRR